jgi:dihydrofolate reductase
MGQVVVHATMSLDGYIAGPDVSIDLPMGREGERLHEWLFARPQDPLDAREALALKNGFGAVVIGRRTFDVGIGPWQDTPFAAPCFVVTHEVRPPLPQKSGTFRFVNDGVASAVRQALAEAGLRDVNLMGAGIVQQALAAGLVDKMRIQVAPLLLGGGRPLFDGPGVPTALRCVEVAPSARVRHLRYRMD